MKRKTTKHDRVRNHTSRPRLVLNELGRETWTNSSPDRYVIDLAGVIRPAAAASRSDVVVDTLIARDGRVRRSKGFHRAVFSAIFADVFFEEFGEYPAESVTYARLRRRYGEAEAIRAVARRSESLGTWQDCGFIPDAYLIDPPNRTGACFEVGDTNPLKSKPLLQYSFAWWALSDIWWDLHRISYDIYGNHRVVCPPEAALIGAALGPRAKLRGRVR